MITYEIELVGPEITARSQASSSSVAETLFSSNMSGEHPSGLHTSSNVSIAVDNSLSPAHTLIHITCQDHKGLLYDIMRTFKDFNIQVCASLWWFSDPLIQMLRCFYLHCLNLATVIHMGLVFSNLVLWSDLIWAFYNKKRKELWDRLVHHAIWWSKDPWLKQAKCIDFSFNSRATTTSASVNDESRSRYWTSSHKPCWVIGKGTATSLPRHSACPQEDQYLHLLGIYNITHPITPFKLIPKTDHFLPSKYPRIRCLG